jgi:hypothetical protein
MCRFFQLICIFRFDAVKSLYNLMSKELPVSRVFQDNLSALESLELQGRLLIDFTVKASIPKTDIKNLSYQDVDVSITVNRFEAEASFGSREPFTLELPIIMPGRSNEVLNFNVTDASFGLAFFVNSSGPIDIVELFSNNGDGTPLNIEYGGDLFVHLPLTVGMSGHNMRIDLTISDDNLFLEPSPTVDYVLDLCDIAAPAKELIELLKVQVLEAIKEPLGSLNVQINIDKVTDPLISKVEGTLKNFTNQMGESLSTGGCNRRFLQEPEVPSSVLMTLATKIRDAISRINLDLASAGIVLSADVSEYFVAETFSVGVDVNLSAKFIQTAKDMVELVSNFFDTISKPPAEELISSAPSGSPVTESPTADRFALGPIRNEYAGKLIDIPNNVCTSGTQLHMWAPASVSSQNWKLYADGRIESAACIGMFITASSCVNGAAVTISSRVGGNTMQLWVLRANGVMESSGCPGKGIDIDAMNTNNGAKLILWTFDPANPVWNQKWTVPTSSPTVSPTKNPTLRPITNSPTSTSPWTKLSKKLSKLGGAASSSSLVTIYADDLLQDTGKLFCSCSLKNYVRVSL